MKKNFFLFLATIFALNSACRKVQKTIYEYPLAILNVPITIASELGTNSGNTNKFIITPFYTNRTEFRIRSFLTVSSSLKKYQIDSIKFDSIFLVIDGAENMNVDVLDTFKVFLINQELLTSKPRLIAYKYEQIQENTKRKKININSLSATDNIFLLSDIFNIKIEGTVSNIFDFSGPHKAYLNFYSHTFAKPFLAEP